MGDRAWHAGSREGLRPSTGHGRGSPGAAQPGCGGSALMLGVQEREGVVDALFEDLVGELSIG